jgi:hypothetical protein
MNQLFNELTRIAYAGHVPEKELDAMIHKNIFILVDGETRCTLFDFINDNKINVNTPVVARGIEALQNGQSVYIPKISGGVCKVKRITP